MGYQRRVATSDLIPLCGAHCSGKERGIVMTKCKTVPMTRVVRSVAGILSHVIVREGSGSGI